MRLTSWAPVNPAACDQFEMPGRNLMEERRHFFG